MGELKDWAKANSNYIKLGDGESVEGVYGGYKHSSYKGTPLIEYTIDGKSLSSGSSKLAVKMDGIVNGQKIRITRMGEGYETTYEVDIIPAPGNNPIGEEEQTAWDEGDDS